MNFAELRQKLAGILPNMYYSVTVQWTHYRNQQEKFTLQAYVPWNDFFEGAEYRFYEGQSPEALYTQIEADLYLKQQPLAVLMEEVVAASENERR